MKVYLAMDIKDGKVVWGYRGEREKYEEIEKHSEVVSSSLPELVVSELSPKRVYVADLNAIGGDREKNLNEVFRVAERVKEVIVDRGYANRCDVLRETSLLPKNCKPILGTETYDVREAFDGVLVSLDFFAGKGPEVERTLEWLNSFELEGVIVLDVSKVGTGELNLGLIGKVLDKSENPVYVGGGVSGVEDLELLGSAGVDGVIVATAVHRKKIPLEVLRRGDF